MRNRFAVLTLLLQLLVVPASAPAFSEPGTAFLETDRRTRPVAPGVTLTSFDRIDAAGWLRADALSASLSGGATVDYLYSGEVSKPEPLSGPATRAGAV